MQSEELKQSLYILGKANEKTLQNIEYMQKMQDVFSGYAEDQKQNLDNFINDFEIKLSQTIKKSIHQSVDEAIQTAKTEIQNTSKQAQHELKTLTEQAKQLEKVKFTKGFLIQIMIFIILIMIGYFMLYLQKQQNENQLAEIERQQKLLDQYGKNVSMNVCNVQGINYSCVKVHPNQPFFTDNKNGETYALNKK